MSFPTGGTITTYTSGSSSYRVHTFEYTGSNQDFTVPAQYNGLQVEYLIIAGGGAGGSCVFSSAAAGGGGAGGYLSGTTTVNTGAYSLYPGSGGNVPSTSGANGFNGQNSTGFGLTAFGGGGGAGSTDQVGSNGGSGGGSMGRTIADPNRTPGTGTAGQGFAGGVSSYGDDILDSAGGGGGGAGGVGGTGDGYTGGLGGAGVSNDITGTAVTYATGGQGGTRSGGVDGNVPTDRSGVNGLGEGGEGSSTSNGGGGAPGGHGVVIIAYETPPVVIDNHTAWTTTSVEFVQPTFAVTIGDSVYITTTSLVSANFPEPTLFVERPINFDVASSLDGSASFAENINIQGDVSISFDPEPMTANAVLQPNSKIARSLGDVSATFPEPTLVVPPSYFNLVLESNPYLYLATNPSSTVQQTSPTYGELRRATTLGLENYGTQSGTFVIDDDLYVANSIDPLNDIGDGKAWYTNGFSNADNELKFDVSNAADNIWSRIADGNFTVEVWLFRVGVYTSQNSNWLTFASDFLHVGRDYIRIPTLSSNGNYFYRFEDGFGNPTISGPVTSNNNWTHLAYTVGPYGSVENFRTLNVYRDGLLIASTPIPWDASLTTFTNTTGDYNTGGNRDILKDTETSIVVINRDRGVDVLTSMVDEIAVYDYTVDAADIISHNSFIQNFDPNFIYNAEPMISDEADIVQAFAVTQINLTYPQAWPLNDAEMVDPIVTTDIGALIATDSFLASSESINPFFFGNPDSDNLVDPMTADSVALPAFFISDLYYQEVISRTNPYRYVTFDGSDETLDYGTDNEYSNAAQTTIYGPIVGFGNDLNGKSAKTTGLGYVNNGIVLNESEYNDDWGTGQDEYHSTFWMQQHPDDTSTGLRVIWNLNGYYDNQHVILYHYQDKLFANFNNGSGTFIEQESSSNVNLFDGQRHFIVISFDHTGINNYVMIYVDTTLVMTVDLGTYTGQTINGITSVPANSEDNNRPRLGIGQLITPIANTSLQVNPSNATVIFDEITWSKSPITQTDINGLWNSMPDADNTLSYAEAMEASAVIENPENITGIGILAPADLVASAIILVPSIYTEVSNEFNATTIDGVTEAVIVQPDVEFPVIIESDIFFASANLGDIGVSSGIGAEPMTAAADLPLIIGAIYSDYIRYMRESNVYGIRQFNYREVV